MELNERIRSRREELGMSQDELAHRCGYKSRSSINKIELGLADIPQKKVKLFANALQTTINHLIGNEDNQQNDNLYQSFYDRIHKRPQLVRIVTELEPLDDSQLDGVEAYVTTLKNLK